MSVCIYICTCILYITCIYIHVHVHYCSPDYVCPGQHQSQWYTGIWDTWTCQETDSQHIKVGSIVHVCVQVHVHMNNHAKYMYMYMHMHAQDCKYILKQFPVNIFSYTDSYFFDAFMYRCMLPLCMYTCIHGQRTACECALSKWCIIPCTGLSEKTLSGPSMSWMHSSILTPTLSDRKSLWPLSSQACNSYSRLTKRDRPTVPLELRRVLLLMHRSAC